MLIDLRRGGRWEDGGVGSMEFVLLPYSAYGHVSPMLAVAEVLVRRGARVRVVAGAGFRDSVESVGAELVSPSVGHAVRVPAGRSPRELMERVGLWDARRKAWRSARDCVRSELLGDPRSVFVVDPHVGWADAFLRRHGVPVVPFWTTHARGAGRGGPALVNLLPELSRGGGMCGRHAHLVGPLTGPTVTDVPVVDWRRLGERLLVVSLGTVFDWSTRFFREIVEEFAERSEWAVVLAVSRLDIPQMGGLPSNIIARQWIPQRQLLREAEVFITHAGINSVHEALLGGVPMLTAPRIREQRVTSIRLQQIGISEFLPRSGMRAAVERLAGDRCARGRLAAVRDQALAARGAERAADLLFEIGRQARYTVSVAGRAGNG